MDRTIDVVSSGFRCNVSLAAPVRRAGAIIGCQTGLESFEVVGLSRQILGSSGQRFRGRKIGTRGVGLLEYVDVRPLRCRSKMFVPGFGEKSPEAKAAESLHNFFTYVAVKIVCSQLQDYNKEAYKDLMAFVDRNSLKDGDKFVATLLRESDRHRKLALRIMEVRSAYSTQDFEWDNLQRLCGEQMEEANTRLMREFLVETSNMGS